MFFKLFLYGFAIFWGALALFAFRNMLQARKKYRQIREVEYSPEWSASIRVDYPFWDWRGIMQGCFFRFPYRFMALLVIIFGTCVVSVFDGLLKMLHKDFDRVFVKYLALPSMRMVCDVNELEPIGDIHTPIVISNHVCWYDIIYLSVRFYPISFVSKDAIREATLVGRVAKYIQCVFVERENARAREVTLERIKERVDSYRQDSSNVYPLVIFPEGTTSNGRSIMKFKLGAFLDKAPITIFSLNYSCKGFDMGMDELSPVEHFIISMSLKPTLEVKSTTVESTEA
jgi:1-acyl-sn-glycerol-3-phosphate acyltransferase